MKRAKPNTTSDGDMILKTTQKTELDLFSKPVEQNAIVRVHDFDYGSESVITDYGPIQFSPITTAEYYTDLSNCYLKVKMRVLKSDGSVLVKEDAAKVCSTTVYVYVLLYILIILGRSCGQLYGFPLLEDNILSQWHTHRFRENQLPTAGLSAELVQLWRFIQIRGDEKDQGLHRRHLRPW